MLATIAATTPPVGWLILVLALYALVLVPTVLWGLGRVGHRGLAWIILPVFSLAISGGFWLYVHQQVSL